MFGFLLDRWYRALPEPPATLGRLTGITRARAGSAQEFESVETALVQPEQGMIGDPRGFVTVVRSESALELAGGDEQRLCRAGFQLQVTVDLDRTFLPDGSLFTLGDVILKSSGSAPLTREVRRALGLRASWRLLRHGLLGLGGRCVRCSVVQGGELRAGDKVFVKNTGIRHQP